MKYRFMFTLLVALIIELGFISLSKASGKESSRMLMNQIVLLSKIDKKANVGYSYEKVKHKYADSRSNIFQKSEDSLTKSFESPPDDCRPNVFWDWMGGMITKEGIHKDLEALAAQGVGGVLMMNMPDQATDGNRITYREYPGKIKCLSNEWFELVNYAIGEADRLGITFSMLMSPGWSHVGAPWVTPEKGTKKLQSIQVEVTGPTQFDQILPRGPRLIGSGAGNWKDDPARNSTSAPFFYKDVAVVAVPAKRENKTVAIKDVIDLTSNLDANGRLRWDVPKGSWSIFRLGITSENGVNHPAPLEGTGLECDRMDTAAVNLVFNGIIKRIILDAKAKGYHSFKAFETDSYEGGYQDFGMDFRKQFKLRRGYDCVPWLPTWIDRKLIIGSNELTQRFLNDMTQIISDLTAERFHGQLRHLADEYNVEWMTEPYFAMPMDWRTTGSHSTLPGSEFWVEQGSPTTVTSYLELNSWMAMVNATGQLIGAAPDIAALYGLPVVWAEAFTAESYNSAWRNDPYLMKPWGDAAFCRGINQFYMHGFTNNAFDDRYQPGVTMGFWGTQMNRHLTWWPYASSWHHYLARCQFMLRQGRPVNDVLSYPSKIKDVSGPVVDVGPYRQVVMNDESLYNRISVHMGRIEIKGGGSFAALALAPNTAFTPSALRKILDLVTEGAVLIGQRPLGTSPSLENYPACDKEVTDLINEIWGEGNSYERSIGKGHVFATTKMTDVLDKLTGGPDVQFNLQDPAEVKNLDFVHRHDGNTDIFFVCNTSDNIKEVTADFRVAGLVPEQWDPLTGQTSTNLTWQQKDGRTKVNLKFEPRQSFFIVFKKRTTQGESIAPTLSSSLVMQMSGSWDVSFDPKWGGPKLIEFDKLEDWIKRPEDGIKYYSGTATYTKHFNLESLPPSNASSKLYLELGEVHNLAQVTLNGRKLGVIWCAPWHVEIPQGLLKKGSNQLIINVVNTWANRLIGDEQRPDDCELVNWNPAGDRKGSYDKNIGSRRLKDLPDWLINNTPRPQTGRFTFSTWRFYDKNAPLLPSGLIGPVSITTVIEKE